MKQPQQTRKLFRVRGNNQGAIVSMTIPEGDAGVDATIGVMRAMVRTAASNRHRLFKALLKIYPSPDDRQHILSHPISAATSIFHKMKAPGVRSFRADPNAFEFLRDPLDMLDLMAAGTELKMDCDDHSMLVATMLAALGHAPAFIVCASPSEPEGQFVHVLPAVILDPTKPLAPGNIYPIDAQEAQQPGQLPNCGRFRIYPAT